MPSTTITINQNNNFGFTAFDGMIMEGRESAVTLIIKARIVPTPNSFLREDARKCVENNEDPALFFKRVAISFVNSVPIYYN